MLLRLVSVADDVVLLFLLLLMLELKLKLRKKIEFLNLKKITKINFLFQTQSKLNAGFYIISCAKPILADRHRVHPDRSSLQHRHLCHATILVSGWSKKPDYSTLEMIETDF